MVTALAEYRVRARSLTDLRLNIYGNCVRKLNVNSEACYMFYLNFSTNPRMLRNSPYSEYIVSVTAVPV